MDFLLSRLCDACGRMVGGGVYYCSVCRIFFCFYCYLQLSIAEILKDQNHVYVDCPMCGRKLKSP